MYHDEQKRVKRMQSFMGDYLPDGMLNELIQMGFFRAPASKNHHGTQEGDLFEHSLEVARILVGLTERLELKWENPRSPYIVGMFHDLCKVDQYVKTSDATWEYHNATLLPGHGEKSVMMLQQMMRLTPEELYCIRWHMGAFDDKENWNCYGRACTKYPNVLFTHTADIIAARIIGI